MDCRVLLCSQRPCGQPDDDCLHAVAAAVVPRDIEFDLQDAAGKGPLARCATAAWLCGYSTCGVCGSIIKAMKRWIACVCCSGCLCRSRRKPRNRASPGSGVSTPRRDNSEICQAESVAYLLNGRATPLSLVPCRDAARGEKVKLLPSDAEVSSAEDLKHEDGNSYFACCHQHRALYEGQAAKRTCVFEGCDREVKGTTRPGLRLCKLHGAKEERAKPTAKLRNPSLAVKPPVENPTSAKARFVPRDDGTLVVGPSSAAAGSQPSTQATSLRRYLREGKEEASALRACSLPGCGPRETWEDLKSQATAYVTRLPRDYPTKARKAIVYLVTEDCPISE